MNVTPEQKKKLKKVKSGKVYDLARNTLVCGCLDQGAYMQFATDVRLYGLYEALLYAGSYERQGMYSEGTTDKTFQTVLGALK